MPFFSPNSKTRILKIKQAAEVLNCSVKTLYRKVKENKIHSTRTCYDGKTRGTPHLFLIKDLYAYTLFDVKQYSKLMTWQKKEVEEYFNK